MFNIVKYVLMRSVFKIVFLIFFVHAYSQLTNENLIIHYDFEKIEGNVVKDQSGKENDGTITNMTNNFSIENTPNANGRYFGKVFSKSIPGKPGHITTPLNLFPRGKSDYSIAFWISVSSQLSLTCGDIQFIGLSPGSNVVNTNTVEIAGIKSNYFVGFSNYGMPFPLVHLNEFTSADEVGRNIWYHYTLVSSISDDKTTLYINGEDVASISGLEEYATQDTATGSIFIGRGAGGTDQNYIFAGMLDDFRLYNIALTKSEINFIMNNNLISSVDKTFSNVTVLSGHDGIKIQDAAGKNLKVFSMDGKLFCQLFIDSNNYEVNTLKNGFYLLKIDDKTFKILLCRI